MTEPTGPHPVPAEAMQRQVVAVHAIAYLLSHEDQAVIDAVVEALESARDTWGLPDDWAQWVEVQRDGDGDL